MPITVKANDLKERWIIVFAASCCIIVIGAASFTSLYLLELFENLIDQRIKESREHYPVWAQPGINFTVSNVTVFHQDNQLYEGTYKPYIITSGLSAQDYRSSTSCCLRIKGWINNTGDGTAYNGVLHVVAINNEGIAIDANQSFAVTAHMTLGLDFAQPYNGSAIVKCTITPFYLDRASLVNHPETFPNYTSNATLYGG